jgi:hypothetical protein
VEVELDPTQPREIVRAVGELIGAAAGRPADPWWQAGVDEQLEPSGGEPV